MQKMKTDPKSLLNEALAEARAELSEGGLPIGNVDYSKDNRLSLYPLIFHPNK